MNYKVLIDYQLSTAICNAALEGSVGRQQASVNFRLQTHKRTDGIQSSNYNGWNSERNRKRPIGAGDTQLKVEVIV